MPLFFQHNVSPQSRLAVWHITEAEAFFERLAVPQQEVAHPHKRLQHLAGRYLLRYLFPQFPAHLIRIADTRKPFLEDETFHFSISHCGDYAAAIVSTEQIVGIDIEAVTEKAARIRQKFAAGEEWSLVQDSLQQLRQLTDKNSRELAASSWVAGDALPATLIWSCKEAVFKWYGKGEVDFRKHIQISECICSNNEVMLHVIFSKKNPQLLQVQSRLLDKLWLSYVIV